MLVEDCSDPLHEQARTLRPGLELSDHAGEERDDGLARESLEIR